MNDSEPEHRLEEGEIAKCDECQRARPIKTEVAELLGKRTGFGPAGETDMFVEDEDGVICYWCIDNDR